MTQDEQLFWEDAYCAALNGLLAQPRFSTQDAAHTAGSLADWAIAERQKRLPHEK